MSDLQTALIESRRKLINRYGKLLATELNETERQFLHKRIAEEQTEMERLIRAREAAAAKADCATVIAAHALSKNRAGGQSL